MDYKKENSSLSIVDIGSNISIGDNRRMEIMAHMSECRWQGKKHAVNDLVNMYGTHRRPRQPQQTNRQADFKRRKRVDRIPSEDNLFVFYRIA